MLLIIALVLSVQSSLCQPGGKAFEFLEVTSSARVAALGGTDVADHENDLSLAYLNPSLLSADMHNNIDLNFINYFAGINYGYASYARNYNKLGTFAAGIHYLYYGKFQGADETGQLTGTFRAADYSINFMYSRPFDSLLTAGITLKSIYSDLESYKSTAIAFDVGITYYNPDRKFTAGLVFRNIGWQVTTYYPNGEHEPLPFDIALGISQELIYAPLKFFITADHLEKFDLTYETQADIEQQQTNTLNGTASNKKSAFEKDLDKVMRHFVVGTELSLGKNLVLRFGYNYRRRQEMKIDTKPGMVGFSWGMGIKISKFQFSYGRPAYHLAGGANYFSLSVNLDEFNKKL